MKKHLAPGKAGVQATSKNLSDFRNKKGDQIVELPLKSELENIDEIKPFIQLIVKDCALLPLTRWTLLFDHCTNTIAEIVGVLQKYKLDCDQKGQDFHEPPLVFHYHTTLNVGDNFVSTLSMRDPTKKQRSTKSLSSEPLLPCGVLVHQGQTKEHHEAFFSIVESHFQEASSGTFSSRSKILVTDIEFENIWPGSRTVYCSKHLKKTILEYLSKNGKDSWESKTPVLKLFHELINSKSYERFLLLKNNLEAGLRNSGALVEMEVRDYIMNTIVPKIEFYSGR